MPDPTDNRYSNSYDFFMRGEEILSGAQRVCYFLNLIKNLFECLGNLFFYRFMILNYLLNV